MDFIREYLAFEKWSETNYLPALSQLLWHKLFGLFNKSGWAEWVTVSNHELMARVQVGREATFISYRDKLLEAGLLEYKRGKKGAPNRYRYCPFCAGQGEGQAARIPAAKRAANAAGETAGRKKQKQKENKTGKKAVERKETDGRFEEFWTAYPKKAAKGDARLAFDRLDPDTALYRELLGAVEQHKCSRQWTQGGGRYIPYPATWLRGERWKDRLPAGNTEGEAGPAPAFDLDEFERRGVKDPLVYGGKQRK